MPRRLSNLRGNWSFFAVLVFLATICHISLRIDKRYWFYFLPISLIIPVYLGYKGGKWIGFAAGVLSTLPWTTRAAFVIEENRSTQILWGHNSLSLAQDQPYAFSGYSFQFLLLVALAGLMGGLAFDILERKLAQQQVSLAYLIPDRPNSSLLKTMYGRFERWLLPASGHRASQTVESGETMPRAYKFRRYAFVLLPLVLAFVLLNAEFEFFLLPGLQFVFPPALLSPILVLVFALAMGSRAGILMSLIVWYFSLSGLLALLFNTSSYSENLRPGLSIESPAQAVGLAVLSWWLGKAGEIFRDPEKRERLSQLWRDFKTNVGKNPCPSLLIFPLLSLLGTSITISLGNFALTYHPYVALFLAASLYGYYRDPIGVSNRILVFFAIVAWFPAYSCTWSNWSNGITLRMEPNDVYAIVLLALTPLVVARMDFSQLGHCKLAASGFLIALLVRDLYLGDAHFGFSFKAALGRGGYEPQIALLLLHILLFVVAAYLLHGIVSRWPLEKTGSHVQPNMR